MDFNETGRGMVYRHPWELSRTRMLINEWKRYFDELYGKGEKLLRYINIGAGDMFFDDALLKEYGNTEVYADDMGYNTQGQNVLVVGNKHLTNDIDSVDEGVLFDYSIMMDSLEYMPDDKECITKLMSRVKPGGYMFFTLPAYTKLFSDHDRHVGNLRRYDKKQFEKMLSEIDGLEIVLSRHFYFLLFMVRLIQVLTKAKIDPEQKVTTSWKHKETGLFTGVVKSVLNLDYIIGRHLPGLSLMIVCKRK
ncbi:hypothetical protein SAMN02910339_00437 [Lachnospiraceae bacterium YSD2013]|nr:hypothetical protein SAMN02910339_00437 [Lachnospiraceae bacterium YSD2013]